MGRVVKHNVVFRGGAPDFDLVSVLAGQELPEWAEGLVGDHVFQAPEEKKPAPKKDRSLPSPAPREKPKPEKVTVPHRGAAKARWVTFADTSRVKYAKNASRDDIIEAVEDQIEGIEIPDNNE